MAMKEPVRFRRFAVAMMLLHFAAARVQAQHPYGQTYTPPPAAAAYRPGQTTSLPPAAPIGQTFGNPYAPPAVRSTPPSQTAANQSPVQTTTSAPQYRMAAAPPRYSAPPPSSADRYSANSPTTSNHAPPTQPNTAPRNAAPATSRATGAPPAAANNGYAGPYGQTGPPPQQAAAGSATNASQASPSTTDRQSPPASDRYSRPPSDRYRDRYAGPPVTPTPNRAPPSTASTTSGRFPSGPVQYTAQAFNDNISYQDDELSLDSPDVTAPPPPSQLSEGETAPDVSVLTEPTTNWDSVDSATPVESSSVTADCNCQGCQTGGACTAGHCNFGYGANSFNYSTFHSNYGIGANKKYGVVGYPGAQAPGCKTWFGGAYGLLMDRAGGPDFDLASAASGLAGDFPTATDLALASGDVGDDYQGGVEFRLGRNLGYALGRHSLGLEGVYWTLFSNDSVAEFADGSELDDVDVQAATASSEFEVHNVEVNLLEMAGLAGCVGGTCDFTTAGIGGPRFTSSKFLGFRFMRLDESLTYSVDFANTVTAATGLIDYDARAENNLYGAQLGLNSLYRLGARWGLHCDAMFGLYGNDVSVEQSIDAPDVGALAVEASDGDVSTIGELRVGASYQYTSHFRVYGDWRLVGVTNVALAADQIPGGMVSPASLAGVNSSGSLLLHGMQAGVEFGY